MQFALVNNCRVEAEPELRGICPGCAQPVVAKCGTLRIPHWAHRRNKMCDSWWEPETDWHRAWKNNFPIEWHECFLPDEQTGEKHIADIRTSHGLVIEFQHSHIRPQERLSREAFYKNMAWVVDGTRLKNDYPRYLRRRSNFPLVRRGIFRVDIPDECFPSSWIGSSVPVIFDFRGADSILDPKDGRGELCCLFPQRIGQYGFVAILSHKAFTDAVNNGKWSSWARALEANLRQVSQEWRNLAAREQRLQEQLMFDRYSRAKRF
jgi:competence protein CoiA